MLMKLSLRFSALFLAPALVLLSFGCSADEEKTAAQLRGRWEIKEALSNGRPTERLSSLFYVFTPDNQLITNMAGTEQSFTYELDGNVILQRGGGMDADYQIVEITDSVLVLSAVINTYDFRFTLKKVAQ